MYQNGLPDIFATHKDYRHRWIEVKNPEAFAFTAAQLKEFPLIVANGTPIYVLTAATEEEYAKLWRPSNWHEYLYRTRSTNV